MDAVKSFNSELSGLYEVKPPISKAKMTSITRGAIKAIKFYKHVVQSVEKFILKCKPEYKVPGLYVIDSIVRQSRHQFGADRDVFAPRFAKNMQQTFINLFKCPAEDKSKVIRVLNLWQKNQVFQPDVIQPLFDLADPNHPVYKEQAITGQSNGVTVQNLTGGKGSPAMKTSPTKSSSQTTHPADAHSTGISNNPNVLNDPNALAQLQQLHKLLQRQDGESGAKPPTGPPVRFDRKLLDFDYDDDEEEDHVNPSPKPPPPNNSAIETVGSLLSNPEVLRQLQTLQQSMSQSQHQEMDIEKLRKLQEMKQQEEEFDKHLAQTVPNLPFAAECDFKPSSQTNSPAVLQNYYLAGVQDMSVPPPMYKQTIATYEIPSQPEEITLDSDTQYMSGNDGADMEVINLDQTDSRSPSVHEERYSSRRRRSRSRERSRDRGRDRDRDRDRDRRSRRSRSRSRSRDRRRRSRSRDRERDREKEKDKEKEKERRKRGLPPTKKENLSVCSTTLWVGHLSKLVHQEELSDTFGEFGDVVSIDLIPPRGCAFIVMNRRQDASRCLQKLKNHKMQGKAITLAWAPGKGVKGKDLKDYWEVDLGVSYIPWSKLKPDIDIELLEEGGMIDEDTMPAWMKNKSQNSVAPSSNAPVLSVDSSDISKVVGPTTAIDTSQPPPMPTASLLQPPPTLPIPLVNPFQLNNRLLGMNIPPGMMPPNVPIGVPPPNMPPTAMMTNPLLGLGSFPQAPPGLLPPPLSLPPPEKSSTTIGDGLTNASDSLLGMPFNVIPQGSMCIPPPQNHDDNNMDVEMEDADRNDKNPQPLSDQLLASLGSNNIEVNLNAAVNRLHAMSNPRPNLRRLNDDMDNGQDKGVMRGFDRDRDRRDYDDRHDRNRVDRDRRDNRRERANRWGDRDHKDHDGIEHQDDRRERNEKSLTDRLREMAHQSAFPNRHPGRNPDNPNIVFENSPDGPPSLMDRPIFRLNNERNQSEHDRFRSDDDFNRIRNRDDDWDDDPHRLMNRDDSGPPRSHFNRDDIGHAPMFNRDDNCPRQLMNRDDVPRPLLGHDEMFEDDRFIRRDCRDDFMEEPMGMRDEFIPPPHLRGPPGFNPASGMGPGPVPGMGPGILGPGPPGMGPGPRPNRPEFWGPPRPMRGAGPDGFFPRGRLPGPPKFHPRGQHIRGARPPGPHWKDSPRSNFQPRFEGPPDFFRGPPGHFDESPHHPRHRRRDDRRHFRQEFGGGSGEDETEPPRDRRDRQSRWGNSSTTDESFEQNENLEEQESEDVNESAENECDNAERGEEESCAVMDDGGSTPLHDEPQEDTVATDIAEKPQEDEDEGESETVEGQE
ncbi:hypothetical protein RI129_001868 [Pyrocoelia pectoralis]|uniref:Uncharacterized protein n=1 Tax=Pyrocoelia pectoralis TaxID=417401 RepID=A0AAN7W0M9_9COLE